MTKLDTTETRLDQVTRKYDEVVEENRELIERVSDVKILLKESKCNKAFNSFVKVLSFIAI